MGLRLNPHTKYYLIPFCVERNVRRFKKSHYVLQEENCRGSSSSDSNPAFLTGGEGWGNLPVHQFLAFPLDMPLRHMKSSFYPRRCHTGNLPNSRGAVKAPNCRNREMIAVITFWLVCGQKSGSV